MSNNFPIPFLPITFARKYSNMKKIFLSALIIIGLGAQAQELPMPSPAATVKQRIGLTDITVEYSRPSARDRAVYGELVPYGELWRTGANKVPNISFSTELLFGGEMLAPGTYSLLTIPGQDSWTVILNENTEMWGTNGYDETKNVLVVEARVGESLPTETFTIEFSDLRDKVGNLVLRWEKTEIKVPLKVKVHEIAIDNIEAAIETADEDNLWRVYRNAANYFYNSKTDMDEAKIYIEKSISANPDSWYSYWLNAEILAELKDFKTAIKTAKKSLKLGEDAAKESDSEFGYAEMINEAIAEWSEMK